MSEAVHETQPEFWRPPTPMVAVELDVRPAKPTMAEACPRCGTEFLPGSRFCHACGIRRPQVDSEAGGADAAAMARLWTSLVVRMQSVVAAFSFEKIWKRIKFPTGLRYPRFELIRKWSGLPLPSLISFLIGLGCVVAALLVGLLTAKTLVDWQAIQFYRVEWLLAATASFVAGILLRNPSAHDGD